LNNIIFKNRYIKNIEVSSDFKKINIFKSENSLDFFSFNIDSNNKLGEGGYSKVFRLYDIENQVQLALKIETNDFPTEKEISEKISKHCGTINELYILSDPEKDEHYYLMNVANCDTLYELKKYIRNYSFVSKVLLYKNIVEEIRKQVVCLYENNYIYSDFKLKNILVDYDNTGFRIYLGDLGSAVQDSYGEQMATYPPPDVYDNYMDIEEDVGFFKVIDDQKQGIISWGLGMILFLLMIDDEDESDHFLYTNDYDETKHGQSIKQMNDFYGNGFGNYLSYYSDDRKSIYDKII
jgi:serine/threonine protein kinase